MNAQAVEILCFQHKIKILPATCRIPVWPFVVVVKVGHRVPREDDLRRRQCRNSWLLVTSPTTSTRLR